MGALGELVQPTEGGVRIPLQVQPRSSRDRVVGAHGDAVKVQISAPPVEGAANEAIERFFAKLLGVSRSAVRIVQGERGKRKVIEVLGIDAPTAAAALEAAP